MHWDGFFGAWELTLVSALSAPHSCSFSLMANRKSLSRSNLSSGILHSKSNSQMGKLQRQTFLYQNILCIKSSYQKSQWKTLLEAYFHSFLFSVIQIQHHTQHLKVPKAHVCASDCTATKSTFHSTRIQGQQGAIYTPPPVNFALKLTSQ